MSDNRRRLAERCAIAIMAKAPSAGRVKTRLMPILGSEWARDIGICFLRDMTRNLSLTAREVPLDPYIAFAPAGSESAFDGIVEPGTQFILADGARPSPSGVEGFGCCLLQAAEGLFEAGYGSVALLNSDSPTLPMSLLIETVQSLALAGDRVVLGPSTDGGYYIIGMKASHPRLFQEIEWSTDNVASQTRARAADLGLEIVHLEPWYDVDDAASLGRLIADTQNRSAPKQTKRTAYAAPVTAHWLVDNGISKRLADFLGK